MSLLATIKLQETFSGIYYFDSGSIKKSSSGNSYAEIFLRDKSGERKAVWFGNIDLQKFKNKFVNVDGTCNEYHGRSSLVLNGISIAQDQNAFGEFVPSFREDDIKLAKAAIWGAIQEIIDLGRQKERYYSLSKVIESVFLMEAIVKKFDISPCGRKLHYGKCGGAVILTSEIMSMFLGSPLQNQLTEEESIVGKCAILVMKIGCILAYGYDHLVPTVTPYGELLGENELTMVLVNKAVSEARNVLADEDLKFDENLVMRMLHAVLAHDGSLPAKTKEAILINSIYSAHMASVDCYDFIGNDDSPDMMTAYDPEHSRRYFKGFQK